MKKSSLEVIKLKEDLVIFSRLFDSFILTSESEDKKYEFPPGEICISYDYKVKRFSAVFVGRNYDHPFLMSNNMIFKPLTSIEYLFREEEQFNVEGKPIEQSADIILQRAIVYLSKAPVSSIDPFDKYLID
jgi:hypothetical protein